MLKYYRNLKKGNTGSMPVALFVVIMFLGLSVSLASVVASSVARNNLEDNARVSQVALSSAIAIAAEKVGTSAQALMNVSTSEPSAWSALAVNSNNTFSRWWVASSSNAVVNPSFLPAGTWSASSYGNSIWVAVNSSGTAYTSSDGTNWVVRNNLPNAGTVAYGKLYYGLGYFIALPTVASSAIAISADGVTWNTATLPASDTYTLACSTTTCLIVSLTSTTGYYTTNFSSFTTTGALPFTPEAIAFSVSSFVISGNSAVANSNSGISWTIQSISAHNWGVISSINGIFTAFDVNSAGSNAISTSSDGGNTWTDRSLPMKGNWIAAVNSGTQEAAYSGTVSGVSQSAYVYTSDGLTWVTGALLAATAWTGASSSNNGFLVYANTTSTAYFIPVTSTASNSRTLTVSARVQAGRLTSYNNAQYLASMVYSWNTSKKRWIPSKYLGSTSASLSVIPGAPVGVAGTRTANGIIIVNWTSPASTGSSSITSYVATASAGGYYCSSGQLTGTTCNVVTTYPATHNVAYYSCTTGDTPSSTQPSNFTCTNTTTYTSVYTAGSYTCNSGDVPSGTQTIAFDCTHSATYGANYSASGYICNTNDFPSGSQASPFTCNHTISSATYVPGQYQCTNGDTPSGTQPNPVTCTHSTTYSSNLITPSSYSCSSGALSGSNCVTTYSAYISCSNGFSYSAGNCVKANIGAPAHNNWSCASTILTRGGWYTGVPDNGAPAMASLDAMPIGECSSGAVQSYNQSIGKCVGGTNYSPIALVYGSNVPSASKSAYLYSDYCYLNTDTVTQATNNQIWCNYSALTSAYPGDTLANDGISGDQCSATYTAPPPNCTSGDTLSGSTCTHTAPATYNPAVYQCAYGDNPSGTQSSSFTCTHWTPYQSNGNASHYRCSTGTVSGTVCVNQYTSPYVAPYYYCTTGDTPSGPQASTFSCTHLSAYTSSGIPAYYSCTSGDSPSGTQSSSFTCTHTATYNSNLTPASYSCSSGTLAGNLCLVNNAGTQALYNSGGYSCLSTAPLNCTMTNMVAGYYTFTVVASNGVGASPSSVATTGVQSQPSVISYPSSVFSTGQYNQALSPVVTNTSGGSLSYSESGSMPSGVTFNNSTGVITGPASWGSTAGYPFTISVSATDAGTGITTTTPITFTLVVP